MQYLIEPINTTQRYPLVQDTVESKEYVVAIICNAQERPGVHGERLRTWITGHVGKPEGDATTS
jgi:hypothetical protein